MTTVSITVARGHLPEVVDAAQTEAVTLERHGQAVAVLLSPERYEQLMDALEMAEDIVDFDAAMAEGGPAIPWEQVKADLGW